MKKVASVADLVRGPDVGKCSMDLIRLADREDLRKVEEEWQLEFVFYVLSNIGVPEEILAECFPADEEELTVEHKIKLRSYMKTFDITIVDDRDHGLTIYVEQTLIAKWNKCRFVLKQDYMTVDPSKRLYVEIHADMWTIFDEEGQDD